MKLQKLLPAGAKLFGSPDIEVNNITFKSQKVQQGTLFVALPGATVDGARFIPDAIQRGAAAIMSENGPENHAVPWIQVTNARKSLSEVSKVYTDNPSDSLTLLGITGTKGKTTSTYLTQAILQKRFGQAFRFGTIEYDLGYSVEAASNTTPESLELQELLQRVKNENISAGVIEVSSHALKTYRVEDITFAAVAFSNLSLEHTEFHSSMEDYYLAKRRLFLDLPRSYKPLIIGIDDEYGRRLASECRQANKQVVSVSLSDYSSAGELDSCFGAPSASFFAKDLKGEGHISQFSICHDGKEFPVRLHLAGKFNVFNALLSAALCKSIGVSMSDIIVGLESITGIPGRFETIQNNLGVMVIVDYAHSPAALANVLSTARPLTLGRLISVFGCGGDRSKEKRPVMGKITSELSDITVVTSDNPRKEKPENIIEEILTGIVTTSPKGREIHVETNRRKAIMLALGLAKKGDTVIIAGKGHETGQTFADHTIPFDDREVAREILQELEHG